MTPRVTQVPVWRSKRLTFHRDEMSCITPRYRPLASRLGWSVTPPSVTRSLTGASVLPRRSTTQTSVRVGSVRWLRTYAMTDPDWFMQCERVERCVASATARIGWACAAGSAPPSTSSPAARSVRIDLMARSFREWEWVLEQERGETVEALTA